VRSGVAALHIDRAVTLDLRRRPIKAISMIRIIQTTPETAFTKCDLFHSANASIIMGGRFEIPPQQGRERSWRGHASPGPSKP